MSDHKTIKILSVDDEQDMEILMTQKFRSKIRKGLYEFHFANNGLQALTKLVEQPDMDIILCDINMPEMDGLTLLTKLNELKNPSIKTIMVSAYGDMDNIRAAMNGGAFDFATKPIDFTDLEQTIEKAIAQIEFIRNAQKEHDQLVSIQNDLDIAQKIQKSILSNDFKLDVERKRFELFASMKAAKMIGGDFYDFFMIDEDKLGVLIADVSDKGIPAAIYMAVSHTIMRATGLRGLSPAECMRYTNNLLSKDNVESMFVTAFYAILDLKTGHLNYCNAGHNPPYVIDNSGEVTVTKGTGDMVVGVMEGLDYHEAEVQLQSGNTFFLFTDGVTEAYNKNQDLFTEERLEEALVNTNNLSVNELVEKVGVAVSDFASGAVQSDDITMMAISYKG